MKHLLKLLLPVLLPTTLSAQLVGFESEIPQTFTAGKKELSLSSQYYKEGNKSLQWSFRPGAKLDVAVTPFTLDSKKEENWGITLWLYNEKPQQDSLRFEFLNAKGEVSYWFTYQLKNAGWRACWIGFQHMRGDKKDKEIVGYRLVAPNRKGRIFIDRLTFPMQKINQRTTPDEQMPYNNSLSYRDLWHWCRVWQWEQYKSDLPLQAKLEKQQLVDIALIEQRLNKLIVDDKERAQVIKRANGIFNKAGIRKSGDGFVGAPIVAPDEVNRKVGELSWNDIESMLTGFAYDAYYNKSAKALDNYFTVCAYAMNQGFAYGSGMGTNHHYGYQIRKVYTTAWMMRDAINKSPMKDDILATLQFWSALQESRKPYQDGRDELLDSWHTLLPTKLISAMMITDPCKREQALRGLSRWVSTSLVYTPGTIGGIKIDGTAFHHGGFYPAYSTGALAMVAQYAALTAGTQYEVSQSGRNVLKKGLEAMRNYSNLHEWGTGIGGRHPFKGSMKNDDVEAFGWLASAGDLSGGGMTFDAGLAADYLRLLDGKKTELSDYFTQNGVTAAQAPQGFFVYNYGAAGIFRGDDWMVTLKGYNTDVWGSEIYTKDNRFGRYQSYGSLQILGKGSREASGFNEEGWDWNRLPGTTTIHLPLELLNSPLPGTTMAHSKENFSGTSSLQGVYGMFATKLMERNLKNFTPDFVARKSAFCFDNRMICLGSNISNSNTEWPTETTLFQSVDNGSKLQTGDGFWLCDGYDNYYHVALGSCKARKAEQNSLHEKSRKETKGKFSSAWIEHGKAPQGGEYEYLVMIQPSFGQLVAHKNEAPYRVLSRDSIAHGVYDNATGIYAYAAFENYAPQNDELLQFVPAETMVMWRNDNGQKRISVCDPNLNIEEKAYTTSMPSRVIQKEIKLNGNYRLVNPNDQVKIETKDDKSILTVACQHGQPVEFLLVEI